MKKLIMFTNHYDPESFRINTLSKEFSREFDVKVITQIPNYPLGSFYNGYTLFKKRSERKDNIDIKRLFTIPRKKNPVMLFMNYISYSISSYFYGTFTKDKPDHVYVYVTSPIFLSFGALKLAKRRKVNSTLYLLDLWPDSLEMILGIKNKFILKRLYNMTQKIYHRFDNIIVSSESFKFDLIDRGISESKITHIPQHADEIPEKPISLSNEKEILRIVFTGNIGNAQGLDVLVDASEILVESGFKNFEMTIVGDGRYRGALESHIKNKKLESYFTFTGQVDSKEIPTYLSKNHLGFVSLKNQNPLNKTLPAKIQSYMAYGIPILAAADGEIPNTINNAQCGFSVSADSPEALAQKIIEVSKIQKEKLSELGYNGHKYSKDNYELKSISKKFINIMKEGL